MERVELALELQVVVNQLSRSANFSTALETRAEVGVPRALGTAPLALPDALIQDSRWYSVGEGMVLGIDAHTGIVAADQIQVTVPSIVGRTGAATFERVAIVESNHFDLAHDFRKTHSEVATVSRFLVEISYLAGILNEALSGTGIGHDHPLFDERLHLRSKVLQHLMGGDSLFEYPDFTNQFGILAYDPELLVFDTLEISVRSPLFSRLKPYIQWDPKVGVNTVLSAIILLNSLGLPHR